MFSLIIETQMRAGTHYVLDGLIKVYGGKVLKIKNSKFEFVDRQIINEGLYKPSENNYLNEYEDRLIFHHHYYHTVPKDNRYRNGKKFFLIGYPFDSFYSDGLIFSSEEYNVLPSSKNKRNKEYRLTRMSTEWNFLEPYMKKNAKWLNKLSKRSDAMVIRYEDFFLKFDKTTKKIEEYCGPFLEKFPTPRKNPTRMYWSNRYKTKIDLSAFEALKSLFINSVKYFYPEKLPISYNT
jgi:hypothetical protein